MIVGNDAKIHVKKRVGALPADIVEIVAIIGRISADFVKVKPNIRSFQHQVN